MKSTPTEKQYRTLLCLGSGAAGLSMLRSKVEPFLRHGWVTADFDGRYYQMVRLTPTGFYALAAAVEKYGRPKFKVDERSSQDSQT